MKFDYPQASVHAQKIADMCAKPEPGLMMWNLMLGELFTNLCRALNCDPPRHFTCSKCGNQYNGEPTCRQCAGIPTTEIIRCHYCDGEGEMHRSVVVGGGFSYLRKVPCPVCHGKKSISVVI